jgi:hypothetical protein
VNGHSDRSQRSFTHPVTGQPVLIEDLGLGVPLADDGTRPD